MVWIVESRSSGRYRGVVAFQEGTDVDPEHIAFWSSDATAREIAHSLAKLAATLARVVEEPTFGVWGPVANNKAAWILGADGKIARFHSKEAAQVCAHEYTIINGLFGTPNAFRVEELR